jgi:hypothetical protein
VTVLYGHSDGMHANHCKVDIRAEYTNLTKLWIGLLALPLLVTEVCAQPTLPAWVEKPVGSVDHPVGMDTLYVRCPWARVFPDGAGWANFAIEPNLRNDASIAELEAAVDFYNMLHSVNGFYSSVGNRTLSEEDILPLIKFYNKTIYSLPKRPEKGVYETSVEFAPRLAKWENQLKSSSYSVVIENTEAGGLSGMPEIALSNTQVSYDADRKEFYIKENTPIERRDRRLLYNYAENTTSIGEEATAVFKDAPKIYPSLSVSFDPIAAQAIHPYLAIVATGRPEDKQSNLENKINLHLTSLEIRDVCSNKTLTRKSFQ